MRDYIVEEFHRSKNKYIDQNKIYNGYFEKGFSYNNYELIFFVVDYLYERALGRCIYKFNLPLYFKRMQIFRYYNHPSIRNRNHVTYQENKIDYKTEEFLSKKYTSSSSMIEEFNNKINKLKEEHEKELKDYACRHKQTENELLNNSTSSHFLITNQGYSKKLVDMSFKFN
eukprot:gene8445-270_t